MLRRVNAPSTHLCFAIGALCVSLSAQTPPVQGTPVPELAAFDQAMTSFMATNGIEAGLLAVLKDGVVVLEHGYGWQDEAHTTPLPHDAMMRIASVSKPITAAAIRKLAASGAFALSDFVFDLGQPGGGLLQITPFPSLGDARLAQVTVQHLLDHEGGWDRDLVGDISYREVDIAVQMGVLSPPGRSNTARWMLGRPLEFTPGSRSAYSNVGYFMLGLLVEQYSGSSYITYVRNAVFGGLPVAPADITLGATLAANHDPREPWYESSSNCTNVFAPWSSVNCPYGGWHHEARVGQGNVVSATLPLVWFLDTYVISGPSIGAVRTHNEGSGWRRSHTGSFRGTNALARQRGDGIVYAVLFNERATSGTSFTTQIRTILDDVIDNQITTWPTVAASVQQLGGACATATAPLILVTPPVLGGIQNTTVIADFSGVATSALTISFGSVTPVPLGGGCALWFGPEHVAAPLANTVPNWGTHALPIPLIPAMAGSSLTLQAVLVRPGGAILGVADASQGIEAVIGH